MKKFSAIVCALALVAFAAQADAAGKSFGIKGGVNMGDLSGDDVGDTSMRNGFMGGAFLAAKMNESFGGRIEVLYVQKGAEEDTSAVTYKLDYIEIPVLFVAEFPAGEKFNLNVFAGPTFAFKMGADAEYNDETIDISDDIKGFEFGAAIGAGAEIVMSSFSIVFDARYTLGASSVVEDQGGESVDVKNRGIGIMAGVSFPLGGSAQ